jgi:RNA polymerase-binding transcription factor DksA
MEKRSIESAKESLLARRRALARRRRVVLSEEQELLTSVEPDWEDAASNRAAAMVLESLGENERTQLNRVEAALDRLERGAYGRCVDCRGPIEPERLALLPEAERCAGCSDAL